MYQTVIILLVTAVLTIITTVVTVRVTMTGRVLSQTVKDKFSMRAKRYGIILMFCFSLVGNTLSLIRMVRRTAPLDRLDVLGISLTVGFLFTGVIGLAAGIIIALVYRDLALSKS